MTMSISRLDLNLLRVFDAVMEERSVLRAGQRICLSQSAVSHALGRLREMLDDELFIRTTTGMQPTARALTMAPLIREAWTSLQAAIGLPKFEPGTSIRRFTIAVSDFVTMVMVPQLLDLLKQEAPLVDLVICPDSIMDLAAQIDLGKIDAAIGAFVDVPSRFRMKSLFSYDDVLIARSDDLGELSLEKLSGLSIATVSLHGQLEGRVEESVYERGLARRSEMFDRAALDQVRSDLGGGPRMAISLPHFLALPSLLDASDIAAIVPRTLARALARRHSLSIYELPYLTHCTDVSVLWHARHGEDAPQQWLRQMLGRASEPLRGCLEFERPIRSPRSMPRSCVTIGA